MANKQDVLKALKLKYEKRRTELYSYKESPYKKQMEAIEKKAKRPNDGNAVDEVRKFGGYDVKIKVKWYNVSTEIVDKRYRELKKKSDAWNEERNKARVELDRKYNDIMENILLFGASDELVKLIDGF